MERTNDGRPLMVTIQCFAYNQELYIRQCLDGFVMQKTNFRFEAIVHDDASTDGTADIVREYAEKFPDIIIPVLETENQYSKHDGALQRIMNKYTRGKYIAICEGDDYWIDPLKLQKQVAFLEAHPDYGLVHTNRYDIKGNTITPNKTSGKSDPLSVLLRTGISTLTTCYRTNLFWQYLEDVHPQDKGWLLGDAPLWKYIAFKSKIHFMPDYTAVYRVLPESASHSKDINKRLAFVKSQFDVQTYMCNMLLKDEVQKEEILRKIISDNKIRILKCYMSFGKKTLAIRYLFRNWNKILKIDLIKSL